MQLYAITNRRLFPNQSVLLECVSAWARGGVDYVQVREKDLSPEELAALARKIVHIVREAGGRMRVLLNGPAEAALECGCDGVHLPSGLPSDAIQHARKIWSKSAAGPVISVSCHTIAEIEHARRHAATLALFAPVFEKRVSGEVVPGQGIAALSQACRFAFPMPVFALGGVTVQNAGECIGAGAAGVAAIRLFASGEWRELNRYTEKRPIPPQRGRPC
jgi:thiamine-phosphate pyrophosphorylase